MQTAATVVHRQKCLNISSWLGIMRTVMRTSRSEENRNEARYIFKMQECLLAQDSGWTTALGCEVGLRSSRLLQWLPNCPLPRLGQDAVTTVGRAMCVSPCLPRSHFLCSSSPQTMMQFKICSFVVPSLLPTGFLPLPSIKQS